MFTPYAVAAAVLLAVGLLLSLGQGGTWWLLGLSALAWLQRLLLRREILTSGRPLRLFSALAWLLLGFALVSLLPALPAQLIGDVLVLLVIAAAFLWPWARRAR